MTERVVDPEIMESMRGELLNLERDPVRVAQELVDAAEVRAKALRAATIKQTLPSDWVKHKNPQTEEVFCYLQDSGCQRAVQLWGISFEKIDLRAFLEEILPDDSGQLPRAHVAVSIMVTGRAQLGRDDQGKPIMLHRTEIGTRSTSSQFFRSRWESDKTTATERHAILQDVKKAALTNGIGRVTRALTGMSRMPLDQVTKMLGCKPEQLAGVEYRTGAQGGGQQGSGPNERQLKALVFQVVEHVEGIGKKDFDKTLETLQTQCELSSRDCSQLIDALKGSKTKMPAREFWKRAGWKKPEEEKPAEAAAGDGKAPEGEGQPEQCPGCKRTVEHIQDEGHTPECKNQSWGAK